MGGNSADVPAEFNSFVSPDGTQVNLAGLGIKTLPEWLTRLSGITTLKVNNNQLTTLPNWLADFTSLSRLWLQDNMLATAAGAFE